MKSMKFIFKFIYFLVFTLVWFFTLIWVLKSFGSSYWFIFDDPVLWFLFFLAVYILELEKKE